MSLLYKLGTVPNYSVIEKKKGPGPFIPGMDDFFVSLRAKRGNLVEKKGE